MNATTQTPTAITVPDHDAQLVDLWLHGRCQGTTDAYRLEVRRFRRLHRQTVRRGHPCRRAGVRGQPRASGAGARCRALAAVKSLFAFGHRLGLLPVDVAPALRLPTQRDSLSERILPETDVHRMLALEVNPRNHCLLRLLYAQAAGCRSLPAYAGATWPSAKTAARSPSGVRAARPGLSACRRPCGQSCSHFAAKPAPMLRYSARGITAASSRAAGRAIVTAAARRAGIEGNVSPHWLRHCHGSHALDRGAPIHLVQATLGHANVATTGKYLHARPTEERAGIWPSKTAVSRRTPAQPSDSP